MVCTSDGDKYREDMEASDILQGHPMFCQAFCQTVILIADATCPGTLWKRSLRDMTAQAWHAQGHNHRLPQHLGLGSGALEKAWCLSSSIPCARANQASTYLFTCRRM